jgi:hypothetical protein
VAGALVVCSVLLVSGIAWLALRESRRAAHVNQNDHSHYDSTASSGAVDSGDSLRGSQYASGCDSADTDSGGGCDPGSGGGD